jgi:hypothetical protein
MFQSTIRPSRRAAQLAAIRIAECVKSDAASTDSDSSSTTPSTPNDNSLTRARNNGYDDTVFITRYLLEQCTNAKFEDNRVEIAEQLFSVLAKNPNILIYEPRFRSVVEAKVTEIEQFIEKRMESFKKAQYREAIDMMKLSMRINIRNSKMRDEINSHLAEISTILNKYDHWSRGYSLKLQLKKMTNILKDIKTHPDYVLS